MSFCFGNQLALVPVTLCVTLASLTQLERLAVARAPRASVSGIQTDLFFVREQGHNCFLRAFCELLFPLPMFPLVSPADHHGSRNWQTRSGRIGWRSGSVTAVVIWLTDRPVKRDGQVNRCAFHIYGLNGTTKTREYVVRWAFFFKSSLIFDFTLPVVQVWGCCSRSHEDWRVSAWLCLRSVPSGGQRRVWRRGRRRGCFRSGDMAAAIASGLIRQKRQAREQHAHRPTTHRRRKSPGKKQGLCNGNLVDIFSKVRIFGLKKRRLRRQGVRGGWWERRGSYNMQHACTPSFHSRPTAGARVARTLAERCTNSRPFLSSLLTHTHAHTHTVMSCSVLWFTSFQVHPLLKPQISLSGPHPPPPAPLWISASNFQLIIVKWLDFVLASYQMTKNYIKKHNWGDKLTF